MSPVNNDMPHDFEPPSPINRREAIRRAALLAGVALSPELVTFVGRAQTAAAKSYLTAA